MPLRTTPTPGSVRTVRALLTGLLLALVVVVSPPPRQGPSPCRPPPRVGPRCSATTSRAPQERAQRQQVDLRHRTGLQLRHR
ncbi:hypothetical protein ACFQZC_34235 [Streptacidiphilus monticola]